VLGWYTIGTTQGPEKHPGVPVAMIAGDAKSKFKQQQRMSLDVDYADSNPWNRSVAHYSAKEVNARSCAWSCIASVVLPGWGYMSLMAFPLPDGRQAYLKQSRRHRTVEVEVVNRFKHLISIRRLAQTIHGSERTEYQTSR